MIKLKLYQYHQVCESKTSDSDYEEFYSNNWYTVFYQYPDEIVDHHESENVRTTQSFLQVKALEIEDYYRLEQDGEWFWFYNIVSQDSVSALELNSCNSKHTGIRCTTNLKDSVCIEDLISEKYNTCVGFFVLNNITKMYDFKGAFGSLKNLWDSVIYMNTAEYKETVDWIMPDIAPAEYCYGINADDTIVAFSKTLLIL